MGEAAFDVFVPFAQERLAAGTLHGVARLVEDLFDDGALVLLAALAGVGIADDGADVLALQAAAFLDGEAAFVGG